MTDDERNTASTVEVLAALHSEGHFSMVLHGLTVDFLREGGGILSGVVRKGGKRYALVAERRGLNDYDWHQFQGFHIRAIATLATRLASDL